MLGHLQISVARRMLKLVFRFHDTSFYPRQRIKDKRKSLFMSGQIFVKSKRRRRFSIHGRNYLKKRIASSVRIIKWHRIFRSMPASNEARQRPPVPQQLATYSFVAVSLELRPTLKPNFQTSPPAR